MVAEEEGLKGLKKVYSEFAAADDIVIISDDENVVPNGFHTREVGSSSNSRGSTLGKKMKSRRGGGSASGAVSSDPYQKKFRFIFRDYHKKDRRVCVPMGIAKGMDLGSGDVLLTNMGGKSWQARVWKRTGEEEGDQFYIQLGDAKAVEDFCTKNGIKVGDEMVIMPRPDGNFSFYTHSSN